MLSISRRMWAILRRFLQMFTTQKRAHATTHIYLSDGNIDDIDKQTKTYFDTMPPFIFFEDAAKVRMSSVSMFVKLFFSFPCFIFKIIFNKKSFTSLVLVTLQSLHIHQVTVPVWLSKLDSSQHFLVSISSPISFSAGISNSENELWHIRVTPI